jgi:enoyl-CoA hydratase
MRNLVSYQLSDAIATITIDDGKVNALSMPLSDELNSALDRAEADAAKQRARRQALEAVRQAIEDDARAFAGA